MEKEEIGKLVYYERNKKNIDIKALSRGICSASSLQRLERGERTPDFFLLERIMERLGFSMNKIEFLHDEHTYDICYLRELIEDHIVRKEYGDAEGAIRYYEGLEEAKEPLHIQYIYKMRAVLAEKRRIAEKRSSNDNRNDDRNNDCNDICKDRGNDGCNDSRIDSADDICNDDVSLIEKAMEQTMRGFSIKDLKNYVLGEEELILLLMWLRAKGRAGEGNILHCGEEILRYIEYTISDEEALANLYSKAAWIVIEELEKENRISEALSLCIKSVEILTENDLLLHLPQYLELILKFEKKQDEDEYNKWKKQRDAIKWLYEEYGHGYEAGEIELWKNYSLSEACLISELIGGERKALNHTQEELARELEIDQKTISRIETGRYKPKQGTFMKLKEYMELDRDICNMDIVVNDFELRELKRAIAKENNLLRFEKAVGMYAELKSRLSMEFRENVQYVKFMDCCFKFYMHDGTADEEILQQLTEAIQLTRRNCSMEDLDKVVLTDIEITIICYIALVYNKMNRKEEAIKLFEKVKARYDNSRVDIKFYYRTYEFISVNLGRIYAEANQLEKAITLCRQGIQYALRFEQGGAIAYYFRIMIDSQKLLSGDKEAGKHYYRQAYQILKLYKKTLATDDLEQFYIREYGEEID